MSRRSKAAGTTVPRHQDPELNYRQTLISLQQLLPTGRQRFSRLIHRPAVESLGDALDATILRPSLLLGGLLSALVVEGLCYVTARYYGFGLSGSEVIIAFIIGAAVGLLLELIGSFWRRT